MELADLFINTRSSSEMAVSSSHQIHDSAAGSGRNAEIISPFAAEKHQTEESLRTYFFDQILDVIGDWDPFLIPSAPTLFLVYAHQSKDGEAMAEASEKLISWLKTIRAKLRSDKSPLGLGLGPRSTLDSYEDAAQNIVSNQLCLLPRSSYQKSVDKVVLCCSEALWNYYQFSLSDPDLQDYSKSVKAAYSNAPKEPTRSKQVHSDIEQVVDRYQSNPKFHHVLTELVFLDIRKQELRDHKETGVIPVILNGDLTIYNSLPGYVEGTDLYINLELEYPAFSPGDMKGTLHNLFFKLMGRIIPHDDRIIRGFKTCYNECANWSSGRKSWSEPRLREEFKSHANIEIFKLLYRLRNDISADGRANRKEATLKDLWNVPFDRNRRFVGRKSQLGELADFLLPEDRCQSTALYGLGGAGKSQIALEYAYRKREICPGSSIFWVSAVNPTTFIKGYLEMGEKLQISDITEMTSNPTELIKAVKRKMSAEFSGKWLLIIDNVDKINVLSKEVDEETVTGSLPLLDCLPRSPQGSIIFTTRIRRTAYDLAGDHIIPVDAMAPIEARALLEKWVVPRTLLGEKEVVINKLLELLTRLPLAIIQAGAYMTRDSVTASDYIEEYEESKKYAVDLLSNRVKDERDPVEITWQITFNQIRNSDDVAARYLSSMACVFYQNIPEVLLPQVSRVQARKAIATLKAYSFVTERNPGGPYDMHPLVHLMTQQWLEDPKDQKEGSETETLNYWARNTILRIGEVFPDVEPENRDMWNEYLPHAMEALFLLHSADDNQEIEIELLAKVEHCLECNGQYKQAVKAAEREVQMRKSFAEHDPETFTSMSDLGFLLAGIGKYKEAEKLLREAIKLMKSTPGSEDNDILTSTSLLAWALSEQGKLAEAEELNRQVLTKRELTLGLENHDTVTSRSKLAAVLGKRGKYDEAEAMHRQVLKSREKSLGLENPDTLTTKSHLAFTLKSQKKYAAAEEIYREILEVDQRRPEHPNTLSTMSLLGALLHCRGKDEEAEQLLRKTLSLRKKVLDPEHHQTLLSMSSLALVLNSLNKFDEAEEMQKSALAGLEKLLTKNHDNVLTALTNLSSIFLKRGLTRKAGDLATKALTTMEDAAKDPGKDYIPQTHPETIASLNNVILIYRDLGKSRDAEKLGKGVLEIARRQLGDQHYDTIDCAANLASLNGRQETPEECGNMPVWKSCSRKRERDEEDIEDPNEGRKRLKESEVI